MIAAISDGPLPIGDILLAAATASVVVVVAANWNEISSKWTFIVTAFKKAFTNMTSNITSAFSEIKSEIPTVQSTVTISNTTSCFPKINGRDFACTHRISEIKKSHVGNNKHFVAVLYNNDVFVDIAQPIEFGYAKYILVANNRNVGIFSPTQTYAKGLAGASPRGPENHGDGSSWY